MSRRALLIGVDKYVDEGLALNFVRQDLAAVSAALARAGYPKASIKECLSSDQSLSTATLRRSIKDFLRECVGADEVLVYFSGHGAEHDGHRVLVPADYYLDEPRSADELVSDAHLYSLARDCAARTVLFVVDACREGVKLVLAKDKGPAQSDDRGPVRSDGIAHIEANSPTVAILYSCAKGEVSRATEQSFFTEAFCRVLSKDSELATLGEVFAATRSELLELLIKAGLPAQSATLDERPIRGRGGDPYRIVVKENLAARTRQRIEDSLWCSELRRSSYWPSLAERAPGLADQVDVLVQRAEALHQRAAQSLVAQRWRDLAAPLRVVRYLAMLCPPRDISPAEAAIALTTPFVYEAVLAAGELLLAETSDPLDSLNRIPEPKDGRAWLALRNALASHETFVRRHRMLVQRGETEAAHDLAAWQMLRFLHTSGEVWDFSSTERAGWINDQLRQLFTAGPFQSIADDDRICRLLDGRRLSRFARLLFADFDDIELEGGRELNNELRLGEGTDGWLVDEPALAHLMSLSAKMAIDPRRLSPLLADYLGMTAEFTAVSLRAMLTRVEWHSNADALSLTLQCSNEVVDAALEEAAGMAEAHRVQLKREGCLRSLPHRFDARSLCPQISAEGRPIYQKPHLRLTMDEGRVRELLMGKELYGDPSLALREMYQNALDACRHRRTRVSWLVSRGEEIDPYIGVIGFKLGEHNGRIFVECRDNGIGMADRHLRRLFARAGQRFTDSHEFHLEKARWDEAGISFSPNSRFGIGVYSYFMLADEIHVETKRLEENGIDTEPGLAASVGGGSLFRLRPEPAVQVGTRIRLYLNDDVSLKSLQASLLAWLWLPEFDTRLEELDGSTLTLPAGAPTRGMTDAAGPVIAVPASNDAMGRPRLFWALQMMNRGRHGVVLSDGVMTQNENIGMAGLVINLTEEFRPELSVDRTRLAAWPLGQAWVRRMLLLDAWRVLPTAPKATLQFLGALLAWYIRPLLLLDQALRDQTMTEARLPFNDTRNAPLLHLSGLGLSTFDPMLEIEFVGAANIGRKYETLPKLAHKALCNRIAALAHAGQLLPPAFSALAAYGCRHDDLSAGAALLLEVLIREGDSTILPMSELLSAASSMDLSLQEALALAEPLREMGVLLPNVPREMFDYRPHEVFVKSTLRMTHDGSDVSPMDLIVAATDWSMSLDEVINVITPLSRIGLKIPSFPKGMEQFCPDYQLRRILSKDLDAQPPWVTEITPLHLCGASVGWSTLGECWDIAKPLSALGIPVPVLPDEFRNVRLDPDTKLALSRDCDGVKPWLDCISIGSLLHASLEMNAPLDFVLGKVGFLAQLEPNFPRIPDEMADLLATEDLCELVAPDLHRGGSFINVVSLRTLAAASAKRSISLGEMADAVAPLARLGITVAQVPDSARELCLDERFFSALASVGDSESMVVDWRGCVQARHSMGDSDFAFAVRELESLGIAVEVVPAPAFDLLRSLMNFERLNDRSADRTCSAFELARVYHRGGAAPATHVEALKALSIDGWDVTDALAFAEFCRDNPAVT